MGYVFAVALNMVNLFFVLIGIPVLVAAFRDMRFDCLVMYAQLLLQYVSEVEVNFKKGVESPRHPDKEIGNGFTDQVLGSLDKAASEFWASIRPYFLAYVARGPAMATPSFTSPVDKYFWGNSSAHWEQR